MLSVIAVNREQLFVRHTQAELSLGLKSFELYHFSDLEMLKMFENNTSVAVLVYVGRNKAR